MNVEVFFDLDSMQDNLRDTMYTNIMKSDIFILVCTPYWKVRIQEGLTLTLVDLMERNLLAELETGLHWNPVPEEFDPTNHVAYEMCHIWSKSKTRKIIPLSLFGELQETTVTFLKRFLVRDARDALRSDEEYYGLLCRVSNPLGILPNICNLNQPLVRDEYKLLWDKFMLSVDHINRELKEVGTQ